MHAVTTPVHLPFATQLSEAPPLPIMVAQQSSLAESHFWVPQLIAPDEEPEDDPLEDEAPEDEAPEDEAPEDEAPDDDPSPVLPPSSPPELEPTMRPASSKSSWSGSSRRVRPPQPSTNVKKAAVEMVARMDTSPR
jgi:hypothetical protein